MESLRIDLDDAIAMFRHRGYRVRFEPTARGLTCPACRREHDSKEMSLHRMRRIGSSSHVLMALACPRNERGVVLLDESDTAQNLLSERLKDLRGNAAS